VGAYINGCEDGQKGQADAKNQQFHFQLLNSPLNKATF